MSEIRDNFIKSLDDSACGIGKLHIEYYMCPSSNFASKCFKVLKPLLRNLPFFVRLCYNYSIKEKFLFVKACRDSETLIASVLSFRKYDEKCAHFAERERSIVICLPGKCQL